MTEVPANLLERQAPLALNLPSSVAVIGCGGVGSWLAYFLALAGVPQLYLFDHDSVSDSNLNRLPFPFASIGKPKTDTLKEEILRLRPNCDILALSAWTPEFADKISLYSKVKWVAVTTDTLKSRQEIHKWCQPHKVGGPILSYATGRVNYIEAAAEGEFGSAAAAPAEWHTDAELEPGYASVPVWVGPCILGAYFACVHILHGKVPEDRPWRLGWDKDALNIMCPPQCVSVVAGEVETAK